MCRIDLMLQDLKKYAEDSLALVAAIEEMREDAERYRWLRDGGLVELPYDDHGIGPQYPHHEELDAAIDRARGKGIVPESY